jgi:signal transduction histidine kinase/ActR/RegA family two-component response regulator
MNEGSAPLCTLINALAHASARSQAAHAIATRQAAQALFIYVLDPELRIMLPAAGMPKTLRAGASWQALLARCVGEQQLAAEVELESVTWSAHAVTEGGCAFILVGRVQPQFPLELLNSLPLLAAVLRAQQELQLGLAEAEEARQAAARAHQLAHALDAARAAAADLARQLQLEHRRKDEFLAMLAHELRNPLAPVITAIEIMRRTQDGGRHDRLLKLMTRQLQQLTHLVDDLLDVSRVSRGLIELRREVLRMDDVIAAAVESSQPLIESRRHTLQVEGDAHGCWVSGDRVRLTQIFSNLLNNAAKYTEPLGRITVCAKKDADMMLLSVSDNGVGIPPSMLGSVFSMFTQVPGSLDRAPGGLGIGLTLVRTLVQLHGGSVHADSAGLGHGSTFTVRLPLVAPAPAATAVPATAPAPAGTSRVTHVLVVDDNVDAAETMAEMLRMIGARVAVAHDGPQALAQAAEAPRFDLVLLDIGLPGMDGYEIAREWRRRFGGESLLVALTGYGSAEDRRRSAQAGFDSHLVKPTSLDELQAVLARAAPPSQHG